jgi:hypothetical protein
VVSQGLLDGGPPSGSVCRERNISAAESALGRQALRPFVPSSLRQAQGKLFGYRSGCSGQAFAQDVPSTLRPSAIAQDAQGRPFDKLRAGLSLRMSLRPFVLRLSLRMLRAGFRSGCTFDPSSFGYRSGCSGQAFAQDVPSTAHRRETRVHEALSSKRVTTTV